MNRLPVWDSELEGATHTRLLPQPCFLYDLLPKDPVGDLRVEVSSGFLSSFVWLVMFLLPSSFSFVLVSVVGF